MIRAAAILVAAMFLAMLPATPALAQGNCSFCDTNPPPKGPGGGRPDNQAVAITVESDIDFGRLVQIGTGVGRVLIDLATGQKIIFGGLDDLGGVPVQGRALVTGKPNRTVRIDLPSSIVMSTASGGRADLRDFVTDLPALPVLDGNGRLVFHFSGTMYTDRDIANGGKLRGRIPIRVNYN